MLILFKDETASQLQLHAYLDAAPGQTSEEALSHWVALGAQSREAVQRGLRLSLQNTQHRCHLPPIKVF